MEDTAGRLVVIRVGARAGAASGVALAATLMLVAEIASEPTGVPGIDSSTWTPPTGVASLVLGEDALHGSLVVGPILLGLAILMAAATVAGVIGVSLLVYLLGYAPPTLPAVLVGIAWGGALQVALLRVTFNDPLPTFGRWLGWAAYGATLGLASSRLLARTTVPVAA
jgi:hypothetical protein